MSVAFNQVVRNIGNLSADEKSLIAHCLISSLEVQHDDVDHAWAALAEQRFADMQSGNIEGVSWTAIKNNIKQRNAVPVPTPVGAMQCSYSSITRVIKKPPVFQNAHETNPAKPRQW